VGGGGGRGGGAKVSSFDQKKRTRKVCWLAVV